MRLLVIDNNSHRKLAINVVSAETLMPEDFGKYWVKVTDTCNQTLFIHTKDDFVETLYHEGNDVVYGTWEGCWPQSFSQQTNQDPEIPF